MYEVEFVTESWNGNRIYNLADRSEIEENWLNKEKHTTKILCILMFIYANSIFLFNIFYKNVDINIH